jgi:hypothetical protein
MLLPDALPEPPLSVAALAKSVFVGVLLMIVQLVVAGVESTLPASSTARTLKVWVPVL